MSTEYKNILYLGGLVSNTPEDKIPDGKASDIYNIDMSIDGLIQTQKGSELFGNEITEAGNITRMYLYKKNFGTLKRVKLRVRDNGTTSILQWYNATQWEDLKTGLTTGAIMGFGPANGNNGATVNLMVHCNGKDNFMSWNGATSTVVSVTSNTIVCSNLTTSTPNEGFGSTGSVMVNGTEYAYTGITTDTLTGVTPDPTTQNPDVLSGVAQVITEHASLDEGNILLVDQGKLFLSGIDGDESTILYTKTGNVLDFVVAGDGALGDAGFITVMDGGGAITALESRGKNGTIIHKNDFVQQYARTDNGTTVSERFDTLSDLDGSGATNLKALTSVNQRSYFMTGNEGLQNLSKASQDDSINLNSVIDAIRRTLKDYDFDNSAVAYYPPKRVVLIACKDSVDREQNNKVIAYYVKQTENGYTG